ncbi:hypothetical protein GGI26_006543 [Coemansia sp. RSA 1358]|uniref:Uncharacterized protein n=1 Tax=Coemansia umbellata TaxID=1424467 RepID=A0ABQ8PD99_9FUNG|nr:hypothetical protein EDC05_006251 [Coemansia umbellata]KAJ2618477.1 hypothetical protein GGI26_006543 [Coemansia sp. RSA 1358]
MEPSIKILSAEDLNRMWMHRKRGYRRQQWSDRLHTIISNSLPPGLVSREPAAVAGSSAVFGISLAFYTQAVPLTPASAVAGTNDGAGSGASTPHPTRRTNSCLTNTKKVNTSNYVPCISQSRCWYVGECKHRGYSSSITPTRRVGLNGPKALCNTGIA